MPIKVMANKNENKGSSSTPEYKSDEFVSKAAENRYNDALTLVREFYANGAFGKGNKTTIRGKTVKFDAKTINQHLQTPRPTVDQLAMYIAQSDMQEVVRTICYQECQWSMANGMESSFDSRYLEKHMKIEITSHHM
ncbi:hypothetical protein L484_003285 [Morus notabilis]|uniref:Protein FAR1-RELATED SEQUENCE n=1 Tax=Morus notabilis TaxID=981085 RepID=W9QH93_9ROSA|nr:hypothetical protein L484_003285 [Morus notabilis]